MYSIVPRRIKIFWIKLTKYEHWTWWFFFIPILPVYLYYALRCRNLVYFTAANPGIEYGGFFGEKKNEILEHIPSKYKPASHYFKTNDAKDVFNCLTTNQISYPLIFKPDVGERGDDVIILYNDIELGEHLKTVTYPFLVQAYINSGVELGVFYSRLPSSNKGEILSIVQKKFLSVMGDGVSTVEKLLVKSDRGLLQLSRLQHAKPELLCQVPAQGVNLVVEPIGNHCLGTEFMNANHLINEKLNQVFDAISIPFDGFYFGRYDLRINTFEDMYEGKGIQIFELNGVTSEPGHIYDREMTLFKAYRDLIKNQNILYKIAKENLGVKGGEVTLREILQRGYTHFFKGKR